MKTAFEELNLPGPHITNSALKQITVRYLRWGFNLPEDWRVKDGAASKLDKAVLRVLEELTK